MVFNNYLKFISRVSVVLFVCGDVTLATRDGDLISALFSGGYEFIDLTHPFNGATISWPGNSRFRFTKQDHQRKPDGSWYAANEYCAAEHSGTHFDAPYHFDEMSSTVDRLPLESLITPLTVVDLTKVVNGDPNFVLQRHHMDHMLDNCLGDGSRRLNCTVLFRFGWSQYYETNVEKYLGTANAMSADNLNFPGISADVAQWITRDFKNVVGVGVDTPSIDPGSSKAFDAHKTFAKHGLFNMENVNIPRSLPGSGCVALVLPMKITFGSGAPLRLAALCRRAADAPQNFHGL